MGRLAILIESYFFPFFFLCTVFMHLEFFYVHAPELGPALTKLLGSDWDANAATIICSAVAKTFLVLMNLFITYGLIIRRNLKHAPEGIKEVLVPFAGTFFFLLYNFAEYLPGSQTLLVPQQWLKTCTLVGSLFAIAGAATSMVATFNLRHSFGVFVQVRDIISGGLYRFVRHPIYLGYTLSTIGFMLLVPRASYVAVFIASILTTIYRAKLEEKKLLANSPEYRAYAQKTPFLFPLRLFPRRNAAGN